MAKKTAPQPDQPVQRTKRKKLVKEAVTENQRAKLDEKLLAFGRTWTTYNIANAEKNLLQVEAIELMKALELKSTTIETPTGSMTATIVSGERVKVDWDRLKKKVGADVWKKITKPVVDQGLVDQAIKEGLLTVEDVAECSEMISNSPYIRPTVRGTL